ncbi:ArsR/SmtB family transcription factor [Haloarcula marina]|uniref:ArsR/SmtB family transcription factor n=1 Tax=Haloarcula marina TaxID=2961574 RepID=UPI0020B839B8|nr:winged helix-turn-helix domain-containing protein [Halomicroarcula marina]
MSLLPSRGPDASTSQDGELQIVGVDEDVSSVLDALSSETAREILNAVYSDPGTPSELADRLGMSIQKVSYHLEKLENEELITVAGTQYSEKGQEMKVYEPPEDPLVLFVGTRERKRSLRSLVRRLVPVVGLLTAASVVVQILLGNVPLPIGATGSAGGADGAEGGSGGAVSQASEATPESTPTATPQATETATAAETTSGDGGIGIAEATETPAATAEPTATPAPEPTSTPIPTEEPTQTVEMAREATEMATAASGGGFELAPGLAFFLGGLLVVAIVGVMWYYNDA